MDSLAFANPQRRDVRPWIARLVRVGYAAKGLIYLLVGLLALQLAFGEGGRLTDSSGVLQTLLEQPFGLLLLSLITAGILTYAGWELTQAIVDSKHKGSDAKGWADRGLTIIKACVYGTIGVEAFRLVLGDPSSSQQADDYARTAMRFPLGDLFLALVGIGVGLYGARQVWMAWRSQFDDDLDEGHVRREAGNWVLQVGRAGIGARGIILLLVGWALMRAGFSERPSEAGGMYEALSTLVAQPYGQWLLAAVAAGLICFGIFQALHARYARL